MRNETVSERTERYLEELDQVTDSSTLNGTSGRLSNYLTQNGTSGILFSYSALNGPSGRSSYTEWYKSNRYNVHNARLNDFHIISHCEILSFFFNDIQIRKLSI
uniref:Uncharacterized protein n=1 Tax=Cacopsylla melanoneura TaxID=428564 RepID=A0A8D8RHA4_9HEMI